uniref:DNA topoisomerase n=1 Tax=Blastobotrys adeninivorans TaxID=409370 RepID=A0A060T6F5_BLAAD
MRVLCVAEKPSIAKQIALALSGGRFSAASVPNDKFTKNYQFSCNFPQWGSCSVTVTAVRGHLLNTEFTDEKFKSGWRLSSPIELFDARIDSSIPKDLVALEKNIKNQARQSDMLYIWTDCDREGEYIGHEVYQIAKTTNPSIQLKRANFNNVEPSHIRTAAFRPVDLDMRLVYAVAGRIELDLRTGAAFTRFQTLLVQDRVQAAKGSVISYGPCQFPTLGFVVDRYKRRAQFVPEQFWYIELLANHNGEKASFSWDRGRLFDRMAATLLFEACLSSTSDPQISSVSTKPTTKYKPKPLTTVELQKKGASYLRMSSKRIMDVAEKLYNNGYISYPRTETDRFDKSIDLMKIVAGQKSNSQWGQYAQQLVDGKFDRPRDGNNDDKAHPPIHPVKGLAESANLTSEERKVYEFVTRHFLACCSKDAKGMTTTVKLKWGDESFTASGLVVTERNFLDVYPYMTWKGNTIPAFQQGDAVNITSAQLKDGKTSPPDYITEPELIALMDANGIGTDATMAEHIEKIVTREYVVKHERGARSQPVLVPTPLGMALVEGYDLIGLDKSVSKPFLRKDMELLMRRVSDGALSKDDFVNQTIRQYRDMFILVNQQKDTLVATIRDYLSRHNPN